MSAAVRKRLADVDAALDRIRLIFPALSSNSSARRYAWSLPDFRENCRPLKPMHAAPIPTIRFIGMCVRGDSHSYAAALTVPPMSASASAVVGRVMPDDIRVLSRKHFLP